MFLFNFITDEGLRSSLELDYEELQRCLAGSAWKASHVLSGSLIEAVLIDSLVSASVVPRTDALQLDLAQAIQKAKQAGMISEKSADLCSAIRAYRNLIHPGRSVRLGEQVDADTAMVAASLVKIIVSEVSKKRLENYGYTAEQLLAKIERDSSVDAIFRHLLRDTKPIEVERFLISVIPARHLAASDDLEVPGHLLRTLTSCFRTAFDQAADELKVKVTKHFVETLKQGSDHAVLSYCDAFFRASNLQYLSGNDVDLVRDYLLARCKQSPSEDLFVVLAGIGAHLEKPHINKFVDPLLRLATSSAELSDSARTALATEYGHTKAETDTMISKRLATWVASFRGRNQEERALIAEEIKSMYDFGPPF